MLTTMVTSIWVRCFLFFFALIYIYFIRIDEWLDVMNDVIGGLKEKNQFPEWYEGIHKALYRANEFLGKNNLFFS